MLSAADEEAIRERLRTYLSVFEKADPEAYADQFRFRACIWANGVWTGVPDRKACIDAATAFMKQVSDVGAVRGAIHEMTILPLLERVAVNRLRYQRLDADGEPVEDVRANYLMLKGDDGVWRIGTVAGESGPVSRPPDQPEGAAR